MYGDILGNEYNPLDDKGNVLGCLEPLYTIFPDAPRYKPKGRDRNEFYQFAKSHLLKHLESSRLEYQSIILLNLSNKVIHVCIYLGNNKILESKEDDIIKIKEFDYSLEQVIGIFKIKESDNG